MVSLEEVESEFWRLLDSTDNNVSVEYGADLNVRDHGSGFPVAKNGKCKDNGNIYTVSPWNLNNLSVLNGSALRFLSSDISGMIVRFLIIVFNLMSMKHNCLFRHIFQVFFTLLKR